MYICNQNISMSLFFLHINNKLYPLIIIRNIEKIIIAIFIYLIFIVNNYDLLGIPESIDIYTVFNL